MKLEIYTDGSLIKRGDVTAGGYAAVCCRSGQIIKVISGGKRDTTNSRMELQAAIVGLKTLKKRRSVAVITDSQYVMFGITRWLIDWVRAGWKTKSGKPVANKDLWIEISDLCKIHDVEWRWVRGHTNNPFNDRADTVAGIEAGRIITQSI